VKISLRNEIYKIYKFKQYMILSEYLYVKTTALLLLLSRTGRNNGKF